MARCIDCLHYKVCENWAKDCFEDESLFPYECEDSEILCENYTPAADVVPKSEVIELENKLRPLEDKLRQYEQVCGKIIIKDGVGIGLLPDGKETVYILKSIAKVTKELAIKRTKQEVAREIFEEIEREIEEALKSNYKVLPQFEQSCELWNRVSGKIDALRGIEGFIDELKRNTGGDQNEEKKEDS